MSLTPDKIFELYEKLRASGIFTWHEVEQFCDAFLIKKQKVMRAISNICKPAVETLAENDTVQPSTLIFCRKRCSNATKKNQRSGADGER